MLLGVAPLIAFDLGVGLGALVVCFAHGFLLGGVLPSLQIVRAFYGCRWFSWGVIEVFISDFVRIHG